MQRWAFQVKKKLKEVVFHGLHCAAHETFFKRSDFWTVLNEQSFMTEVKSTLKQSNTVIHFKKYFQLIHTFNIE